jgi:hypothetical protein
MLKSLRDEYMRLSLKTNRQLAVEFDTNIDSESFMNSFGRTVTDAENERTTTVIREREDISSRELLASEHCTRDALLRESANVHHYLSSGTIDDDEASALRLLPRATLEMLLLSMSQAFEQRKTSTPDLPHPLGALLGPQYMSYVCAHRAKRAAKVNASIQSTRLGESHVTVRRNGITSTVRGDQLRTGDLLLLKDNDIVPCDAILLKCTPQGCIPSVSTERVNGSILRVPRAAGVFVECPLYGSMSVLPQQGSLHFSDQRGVGVAIVLAPLDDSSWMKSQHLIGEMVPLPLPEELSSLNALPLFASPHPSVLQFHRTALLQFSACEFVLLECETLLFDESDYSVTKAVWSGSEYCASTADRLWDFSDTLEKSSTSGTLCVNSFMSETNSRVQLVSSMEGLRSLIVTAMMATLYEEGRGAGSAVTNAYRHPSEIAVKRFVGTASACITDFLNKYVPESDSTCVSVNGQRVWARLFHYNREALPHSEGKAVLIVWGQASLIAGMASFESTKKGQQRQSTKGALQLAALASTDACQPEFFIGFASAEITSSSVRSTAGSSPRDVASLLAETTSLCYQGGFICQPKIQSSTLRCLELLSEQRKTICFFSFSRTQAQLLSIMKRCGHSSARIIFPDVLRHWASSPPPEQGEILAFATAGSTTDAVAFFSEFVKWLCPSGRRGIAVIGSSPAASAGMKLCHVSVGSWSPSSDAHVAVVLRNLSRLSVHPAALDDLAKASALAADHVRMCGSRDTAGQTE